MATGLTDRYLQELQLGDVHLDTDTLKACLMGNDFTFNPATHSVWSDVSADEIATGNGYNQNTKTLTVSTGPTDADPSVVTIATVSWTATGNIGPSNGMIIYDDTHTSDIIVGYIDFSTAQTATSGGTFEVNTITLQATG